MAYRIIVLPSAESDLERLDPEVRRRTLRRIVWLGEILYWPDHKQGILRIYRIQHRSEVYRHL